MKTLKVWPTAINTAQYYLREASERLGTKWRGSLDRLAVETSAPTSPASIRHRTFSPTVLHSLNSEAERSTHASPISQAQPIEEPISLFEAQMADWARSNHPDQPEASEGLSSLQPNMSTSDAASADQSSGLGSASTTVVGPTPPSTTSGSSVKPKLGRSAISLRTKQLVKSLRAANNQTSQTLRLQELSRHLQNYPDAVSLAIVEGAVPLVLNIRRKVECNNVRSFAAQTLSMLGQVDVPLGRGIRILSIDGGGTRGVIILEILRNIESQTGKPIYKLFDVICGVSTGAILTMLLGANRTTIDQCEQHYRFTSQNLFKADFWRGTSRLIFTHAYYDATVWEQILRKVYGERTLMDTAYVEDSPKLMAISACSTNLPRTRPYVFRNYNLPEKAHGYYEGSSKHKIWQAVRASSSAPGYFEEYILDNVRHQDGGMLINNPTSIAIHEAQLLYPGERIQCVVSIGTGRYMPTVPADQEMIPGTTSLRNKIHSFIESATDTETVHRLLQDLLPKGTYFRINPTIQEWLSLDETREEKIDQLKQDGQNYLKRNEYKMSKIAQVLSQDRSYVQHALDTAKYNYKLYKKKWP